MANLAERLWNLLGTDWKHRKVARRHSPSVACGCGSPIFFRNSQCLSCNASLGYLPLQAKLVPLDPGPQAGTWRVEGRDALVKYCSNHDLPALCNWLVDVDDPSPLCIACRLNRTIPDVGNNENAGYWRLIEVAKRRLVSELLACGLPVKSKVDEDVQRGLMFDFLRSPAEGPRVMTGHANGLITLNIEEADDGKREKIRLDLREPYRTLLGHFRHEVGHYYWDRLVWESPHLPHFRTLFGDERADYGAALKAAYASGPPANWADRYISSYASSHPWEDWAESWAHYLHVIDSLGTALGFGLDAGDVDSDVEPFGRDALFAPDDADADSFLSLLNSWAELTVVLNELARSMGHRDFYPFVVSKPVVAKLQFVHMVVRDAAKAAA